MPFNQPNPSEACPATKKVKTTIHHSSHHSSKKKCPCSTLLFWLDKQHVGRPLRWLSPAFATGEVTASRSLRPRTKGKGITMWSVVVIETLWLLYFQNVLDQTLLWLLMIVVISRSFLDKKMRIYYSCKSFPGMLWNSTSSTQGKKWITSAGDPALGSSVCEFIVLTAPQVNQLQWWIVCKVGFSSSILFQVGKVLKGTNISHLWKRKMRGYISSLKGNDM